MRSLCNTLFPLSLLFYFISDAFSPLLWPKQNVAEPYVQRSEQFRVSSSHDVDFNHENKFVHDRELFHCISQGSTIVYLIGGDGVGNFFLQEFVFPAKSLYQFHFTSLRCVPLLCAAMHSFYLFCRRCAGIFFFVFATTPSSCSRGWISFLPPRGW